MAAAIRYALTRMSRLRPYLNHGILEIDNNTAFDFNGVKFFLQSK